MQNEWKPIESAPKDGNWILACGDEGKTPVVVQWDGPPSDGKPHWVDNDWMLRPHVKWWVPIPDPPKKPVTFTKEQKAEIWKWVEANKRFEEIGSVVCLDDSDGLISFIDALPE